MATVILDAVQEAVHTSRGERILARQRATPVNESDLWSELDDVSILSEHPELAAEPLAVRSALAVRRLLLAMPATIAPDELIVGTFRARLLTQPKVPDYITAEEKARYGIDQNYGWYGHNTLDYAGLLAKGFSGVRAEAQAALERLSASDDPDRTQAQAPDRLLPIDHRLLRCDARLWPALCGPGRHARRQRTRTRSAPPSCARSRASAAACPNTRPPRSTRRCRAMPSTTWRSTRCTPTGPWGGSISSFIPLLQRDLEERRPDLRRGARVGGLLCAQDQRLHAVRDQPEHPHGPLSQRRAGRPDPGGAGRHQRGLLYGPGFPAPPEQQLSDRLGAAAQRIARPADPGLLRGDAQQRRRAGALQRRDRRAGPGRRRHPDRGRPRFCQRRLLGDDDLGQDPVHLCHLFGGQVRGVGADPRARPALGLETGLGLEERRGL